MTIIIDFWPDEIEQDDGEAQLVAQAEADMTGKSVPVLDEYGDIVAIIEPEVNR